MCSPPASPQPSSSTSYSPLYSSHRIAQLPGVPVTLRATLTTSPSSPAVSSRLTRCRTRRRRHRPPHRHRTRHDFAIEHATGVGAAALLIDVLLVAPHSQLYSSVILYNSVTVCAALTTPRSPAYSLRLTRSRIRRRQPDRHRRHRHCTRRAWLPNFPSVTCTAVPATSRTAYIGDGR
jgi:hypothetical protein